MKTQTRSYSPSGAIWLCLVLAVGIALRCVDISERGFWIDEAFSWRITRFDWTGLLERVAQDNHPPLYFLALKAWAMVFGDSAVALRSLSVLCGGVTILGTYLFVRQLQRNGSPPDEQSWAGHNPTVALGSAALVAFSLFQIIWAQQVRMYALGATLAILSSWLLFRALEEPLRLRRWLLFGIADLAFAYTHYYALFSLAAQAVFLLAYSAVQARKGSQGFLRSRPVRYALLASLVVAVGWLPWLPFFLRQREQVQTLYWTPPVSWELVAKDCFRIFVSPNDPEVTTRNALLAVAFCAGGLIALTWRARAGAWYVACSAVGPVAGAVCVSLMDTRVFSTRFLLFAQLFFLIGLGLLIARLRFRTESFLLWLAAGASMACIDYSYWERTHVTNFSGARGVAEYLATVKEPGEPVVASSPIIFFPVLFHCRDRADVRLFDGGEPIPHFFGRSALVPEDMLTAEQMAALNPRRLWVVDFTGGGGGNLVPLTWAAKRRAQFPAGLDPVWGMTVIEYVRTDSTPSAIP